MVGEEEYLMSDDREDNDSSAGDNSQSDTTTSSREDDLIQQLGNDNIEQIMVSGVSTRRLDGVDPKHLAKIWRLSFNDAKKTIGVTIQHGQWMQEPTLSQNYGTNDQMLCYYHIHEEFFMEGFVVMIKAGSLPGARPAASCL